MEKTTSSRASKKTTTSSKVSPAKGTSTRSRVVKSTQSKTRGTQSRNKTKKLDSKTFLLRKTKGKKLRKCKQVSVSPWLIFAAVAVVVMIFIVRPMRDHYTSSENIERGDKIPSRIKGEFFIDISHHNDAKDVKWDSLKVMTDAKGRTIQDLSAAKNIYSVSGVIMKATEGVTLRDKLFNRYWKEVGNTDLKRGAYHFYRSSKNPTTQARHYSKVVGKIRHTDLPPILDVETIHSGCSKEEFNKGILTWLKFIEEKYDRTPILYTYESFAKDYIDEEILENYPIWIAHYKTDSPLINKWDMWQFTDCALVYGFPGEVDLSVAKISNKK